MQSSNGDTDTENRLVVYTQGKERVEQIERPYVKEIASGNLLYDSGNSNRGSVSIYRGGMRWEMARSFKREEIYEYVWMIWLRFDRKQQNFVKQLSFN